jgi:tellurite resistance protein
VAAVSPRAKDLSHVELPRLRAAIEASLSARQPSLGRRLETGAVAAAGAVASDSSRDFQALLEVGYLVASADGFAPEERHALAHLLEHATGAAVSESTLELHFEDLDESTALLGRSQRLLRAAADLEDDAARRDALRFAALVALADGQLGEAEAAALGELGKCLAFDEASASQLVDEVVAEIVAEIERAVTAPSGSKP